MKVGIVGVGKSVNIGDQLIAKSLGTSVESILEDSEVAYYDLHHGVYDVDFIHEERDLANYKPNKEIHKKLYTPRFIKTYIKDVLNASESDLSDFIKSVDIIVIGGGHLLIDNFGDFIIKISNVLKLCKKNNKKNIIWSVGVGDKHSAFWKLLAKRCIDENTKIFTRDSRSCEKLIKLGINAQGAVLDPAFFANEIQNNITSQQNKTVFIMDPYEMVRHSNYVVSREYAAHWWCSLLEMMVQEFGVVYVANNGSYSDCFFIESYIQSKVKLNPKIRDKIIFTKRSLSYHQLLEQINSSDFVIGQRLHSIIPSIAFKKKFLAIKWDSKLENIIKDINQEDALISYSLNAEEVFNKIKCMMKNKIDYSSLDINKSQYKSTLREALG